MGTKNLYGAESRSEYLNFAPETLKVITDSKHPLYDPRVEKPVDEAMVLSIMSQGVIVPLVIMRDGEDVYVVDGRQRRVNAIEANRRLKKEGGESVSCPCVWKRGDEAKLYEIAVVTNELRTGDSPLERAKKMQHLQNLGRSEEQLAVAFGCTLMTVKNTLALLECAAPVQKAVEAGRLAANHATALSKLPREEQIETLEKMVEAGATKGARATKAIKEKKVGEKHTKVSTKDRLRILETLMSSTKTDTATTVALAVFKFMDGDLSAFKSWPHLEEMIVTALMPTVKVKKEPVKYRTKRDKKVANGSTEAAV